MLGGLLQDDLGWIACLALVKSVAGALTCVRLVIKESAGSWGKEYHKYTVVEIKIAEDESLLDELYGRLP